MSTLYYRHLLLPAVVILCLQCACRTLSSPLPHVDENRTENAGSHTGTGSGNASSPDGAVTCRQLSEKKLLARLGEDNVAILQRFTPHSFCSQSKTNGNKRRRSIQNNENIPETATRRRQRRATTSTLRPGPNQDLQAQIGGDALEPNLPSACHPWNTEQAFFGLINMANSAGCKMSVYCDYDSSRFPSVLYHVKCGGESIPEFQKIKVMRRNKCKANKNGKQVEDWGLSLEPIPTYCKCVPAPINVVPE